MLREFLKDPNGKYSFNRLICLLAFFVLTSPPFVSAMINAFHGQPANPPLDWQSITLILGLGGSHVVAKKFENGSTAKAEGTQPQPPPAEAPPAPATSNQK